MPIYDYACKCGCTGEFITKFDEHKECPDCGEIMERQISAAKFMGVKSYGYYDDTLGAFIDYFHLILN